MGIDEKNNGGWGWWMRLMDYGALFFWILGVHGCC